jgi:hypothetical protein
VNRMRHTSSGTCSIPWVYRGEPGPHPLVGKGLA